MKSFLQETAEDLVGRFGVEISQLAIVFQNKRAGLYFREALGRCTQRTIWSPELYSVEEFIQAVNPMPVSEPTELIFELYRSYQRVGGTENLESFLLWGETLLNDFEDMDQYLVDPKEFFPWLSKIKSVERWSPDEELTEFQSRYLEFWDRIELLYSEFKSNLTGQKKAYRGMAARQVAENLEECFYGNEWEKIVFIGFNALTRSEEKIIDYLLRQGLGEIHWDADSYYVDDPFQEAGTHIRRYLKKWPVAKEKKKDFLSTQEKSVQVVGASRNLGQALACGNILSKAQIGNTIVVLADEGLLLPVLHSLPENVDSVNVSMGYPFKNTPLFALVDAVFDMQGRFRDVHNSKKIYFRDLDAILRHPYFTMAFGHSCDKMMAFIHSNNLVFLTAESLQQLFEQFNLPFEPLLFSEWSSIQDAHAFWQLWIKSLNLAFNHERFNFERACLETLVGVVSSLKDISARYETCTLSVYASLMQKILQSGRIPFSGEPLEGLQIMGVLETRALDFENVLVMSANEQTLPAASAHQSLIPFELRRHSGMPTPAEKDAIYAYNFYRILHRARNIFIVYNTETDTFGKGERSRFVTQLEHEWRRANSRIEWEESYFTFTIPFNRALTRGMVKNETTMRRLEEKCMEGISPSALNTYLECHRRFYFKYIAKIREEDRAEETIEAMAIGKVMHRVLEELYRPAIGRSLTTEDIQGWMRIASEKVVEIFTDEFSNVELKSGKNLLVIEICRHLIKDFLEYETQRCDHVIRHGGQISIECLEESFESLLPVDVGGRVIDVKLQGRVDRVERIGREIQIIDYKTGAFKQSETLPKSVEDMFTGIKYAKGLQLLFYNYLYQKQAARDGDVFAGFYFLRDIQSGIQNLSLQGANLSKDSINKFELEFKKQIGHMFNPDIPFDLTNELERCRYCEFQSICRRETAKSRG